MVCLVIIMTRPWVEINEKSYTLFRFWETTRGEGMSHTLYENIEEEYRYYQSQGIDMDINLEETKTELVVFSFLTKGVLIVLPLGFVLMCLLSIWKGDNHGLDAGLLGVKDDY